MADGDELLSLAFSRPVDALAEVNRLIADDVDDRLASYAHHARALVVREEGRFTEAIADLRTALRLARASGDPDRVVDVQATLGLTLARGGRAAAGLATLDAAVKASSGRLAGRVLMRRAHHLATMGRRSEALADLNRAIPLLHRAGDRVWEARARSCRFGVHVTFGRARLAERDLAVAERLFIQEGQELEVATTIHNRAELAVLAGDLPAALACLDEAESRYTSLGTFIPDLVFDRCKVLLAAGLAAEALAVADAGIARVEGDTSERAELLFAAARAAQAAGRPADAAVRAGAARDLFRAQRRPWWSARAAFVLVQSRYDAGQRDNRTETMAARIADRLDELHAEEAGAAHLLAGRLAAAHGRLARADRHLARAAALRRRGPAFGHAAGWLAQALRADTRHATAAALAACRRGLAAAAGHQQRLGAVELRIHAAAYGTELAAIGQRHAVRRDDARMLLRWSERWRAGALAPAPMRGPDDPELAGDLAALREVMRQIDAARAAGSGTADLEHDRRRLESAIRARTRRVAPGGARAARVAPDDVLGRLDDHLLIELVALDGVLHAVTARKGRVRLHVVGPVAAAVREVELARFMLRRLARGDAPPGALERLGQAGRLLEQALLGPAVSDLDGRPVVIAPPGSLHAVPWAMLPALRQLAWCVTPSAAVWLRARQPPATADRRVVIVVGPGLKGTVAEAAEIARGYGRPTVLAAGQATAARVLAALDGARTAHIAAHGLFRADNPLFSSLRLADGPLTVYDLGRLRRAPRSLILSSCESGMAAPVAGDELLGMISVLVPLGTTSLLASVVPVNDEVTAPLMVDVHAGLRRGAPFGAALAAARSRTGADPVAVATASAFIALGH
ncbi:CHAT domain-containing protein [Asanoa siamensis]|uniref:CHAT domain-containing protein n=1 Tax=Asanoa siamensis TaxID=926357 RepID=A0ABQ4CMA6_9ACTN|nr:CHAT domain-containing tetratricopeptide repeat protein [Asanoa siamensis]GIF72419.1 hypothetical protein Asi02nite_19370 [Asanoa siamensis]